MIERIAMGALSLALLAVAFLNGVAGWWLYAVPAALLAGWIMAKAIRGDL